MLTRNDKEIAFNRVNELLRLTGSQLNEAAERIQEQETAAWLRDLAAQRMRLSDELENHIRQSGELPTRPDPDKELFVNMLAGVREALSGSEGKEFHLHPERENELEEAIRDAQNLAEDDWERHWLNNAFAQMEKARVGPPSV